MYSSIVSDMKLKERVAMASLGFSVGVVLVLVVMLDMNLVIQHGEHGQRAHGRVKMGDTER